MEEHPPNNASENQPKAEFKKPVLIGRVGKLPRKIKLEDNETPPEEKPAEPPAPEPPKSDNKVNPKSNLPPALLLKEMLVPIPYKEPKWSGLPPEGSNYKMEVLKSGVIVDTIDLMNKPYHIFGRLANCDIVMAHPTISRHHAVLQYKTVQADPSEPPVGWYVYDLGSTHGTFLNRNQAKPEHYTRVKVGHMLKLGCSTRNYLILGPEEDSELESELTITEMKEKHAEMKRERERQIREAVEQREKEKLEAEKKREEEGIDWGMADDAEEETDLTFNPFASTANEELYLDDPKKTLRGYFEREGLELSYDCEERGLGQFLCRVELPIDDSRGRAVYAEVLHKGKKKEAVVACALEACRILDRHGLLRQAKHESRARKQRDWSADDYYDSDDDTFLDRTGAVERKRNARMRRTQPDNSAQDKPLTHEDLVKKCTNLEGQISREERNLSRLRESGKSQANPDSQVDALDEFMSNLGKVGLSAAVKADISNSKMTIQKLKTELVKTQKLADIAKPTNLPELVKQEDKPKMHIKLGSNSVVYGKRIRLKDDKKPNSKVQKVKNQSEDDEFIEEVDSDSDSEKEIQKTETEVQSAESSVQSLDKSEDPGKHSKFKEKHIQSAENQIHSTEKSEKPKSSKERDSNTKSHKRDKDSNTRVFGPMRPPENYVAPEDYFDQESDRDLSEIMEEN